VTSVPPRGLSLHDFKASKMNLTESTSSRVSIFVFQFSCFIECIVVFSVVLLKIIQDRGFLMPFSLNPDARSLHSYQ